MLSLAGWAGEMSEARSLYLTTRYTESLRVLQSLPQQDASVLELTGQNYFMLGDFKKAADMFESLSKISPQSSKAYLWLGRSIGRIAETANPFRQPGLAVKARKNFEKAVELGPNNVEALNVLLEYYLRAPGFLGGGTDKAETLAARLKSIDPVEYHSAQAQVAESRNDLAAAESNLRRAADLAPKQVGRLLDLARFLARHGRISESDKAFGQAENISPTDPELLFARASVLIETKRDQGQARELLQRYLASALTPDHPPRAEAEQLLRKISGG
jgi:Flp pilus assembly protein TadD